MKTLLAVGILACILLSSCFMDSEIMAAVQKGSYKMCDQLDTSENAGRIDDCYAQVAAKKGDADVCPKIQNAGYRSECYEGVAKKNNDPSLCKFIDAQWNKVQCFSQIAINKNDKTVCRDLDIMRDQCYLQFAKNSNNPADCENVMQDSNTQDECFSYMGTTKKDESFCNKILVPSTKDDCLLAIAPQVQGNLICPKIQIKSKRENCIITVAAIMKDERQCGGIDYQTSAYYTCMKQVAISAKSLAVCDLLKDIAEKDSCIRQVNNAAASANPAAS
jgi:hypothetical protein